MKINKGSIIIIVGIILYLVLLLYLTISEWKTFGVAFLAFCFGIVIFILQEIIRKIIDEHRLITTVINELEYNTEFLKDVILELENFLLGEIKETRSGWKIKINDLPITMYRLGADGFKYYLKDFMNKLLGSELRHKVFEKEELIKITKIMEHYPNMMQQRLMRMVEDFNKAREKITEKPEKEFELLKELVKLAIEDINSDIKNINKFITKLEKEVISKKPLLSYFK